MPERGTTAGGGARARRPRRTARDRRRGGCDRRAMLGDLVAACRTISSVSGRPVRRAESIREIAQGSAAPRRREQPSSARSNPAISPGTSMGEELGATLAEALERALSDRGTSVTRRLGAHRSAADRRDLGDAEPVVQGATRDRLMRRAAAGNHDRQHHGPRYSKRDRVSAVRPAIELIEFVKRPSAPGSLRTTGSGGGTRRSPDRRHEGDDRRRRLGRHADTHGASSLCARCGPGVSGALAAGAFPQPVDQPYGDRRPASGLAGNPTYIATHQGGATSPRAHRRTPYRARGRAAS
jgi:hypothetical protein